MEDKNKAAVGGGPIDQTNRSQNTKKLGKLESMLVRFASGARLHRFQAERVGDHCLPTSVADLQSRHSIIFSRKRVRVPNRFGSETSVCEYWLDGESLKRAREIAGISKVSL